MKNKMCENISTDKMPEVVTMNRDPVAGEVLTINFLNDAEDIDAIKSRLKEMPGIAVETFSSIEIEGSENDSLDINCDYDESNERHDTGGSSITCNSDISDRADVSDKADSLCHSTETLIDQLDSSGHSLELNINRTRNLSGPSNSHSNTNNAVSVATTSVTSGLLISPTSLAPLTQDVHVQMGDDSKRMSTVLESLDLHLVYIPKTQQLVKAKSNEKSVVENGNNEKHDGTDVESMSSESLSASSCSQKNSPLKMATSNSGVGLQILSPGGLDDTSSVCETDFLIRVQEPDQLTCDSSDYVCNFPRINTNDSLLRTFTDASSLSSLSTGTDFSVSAASLDEGDGTGHCIDTGDGGFMEINLHSRNSYERNKNPSQDSGFEDKSNKPKRKGITSFLSRNLFSRKSKESSDGESSQPGWKLFGKVPLKLAPAKDPNQIEVEFKDKQKEDQIVANRAKKEDIEVMSTTALILENRPMNLPHKDPEEMERHQREYEAMVEAARRKEQKELKMKKKHKQQQLKSEEQLMAASRVWTKEILPNWDTMKSSKKARDLWWHGIPTNVRGKVWKLAIGNDLNVTHELYEICVSRAADRIRQMSDSSEIFGTSETSSEPPSSKESSVELIKLDVSRTFPQLCIFQKGGPYHDLLHSLLGAYACYRPDVGYVQGMSFIAAVLLLNMDVADAFVSFANLLNRPCQVAFFRLDEGLIKMYFQTYEEFFRENLPALHLHFTKLNLTPDLYLYDWIFTLFTKSLPLDIACRVWDIFCRDGEEFLFRTALGILKVHEEILMSMDFIHLAQFLTKLPERDWYDNMFRSTDLIQMTVDKKKYSQVLALKRDCKDNT